MVESEEDPFFLMGTQRWTRLPTVAVKSPEQIRRAFVRAGVRGAVGWTS